MRQDHWNRQQWSATWLIAFNCIVGCLLESFTIHHLFIRFSIHCVVCVSACMRVGLFYSKFVNLHSNFTNRILPVNEHQLLYEYRNENSHFVQFTMIRMITETQPNEKRWARRRAVKNQFHPRKIEREKNVVRLIFCRIFLLFHTCVNVVFLFWMKFTIFVRKSMYVSAWRVRHRRSLSYVMRPRFWSSDEIFFSFFFLLYLRFERDATVYFILLHFAVLKTKREKRE